MASIDAPNFSHTDLPDAAELNKIPDSLDAIYAQLGDDMLDVPQRKNGGEGFYGKHMYRWLVYSGTSVELTDPTAAAEDAVTLPDEDGTFGLYDLRGVSWLFFGRHYTITGADYAIEGREA